MALSSSSKIRRVAAAAIAGTTAVNSSAVDMAGFDSVVFVAAVGTAAVNNILSVEDSADGSTGWAAITGAAAVPGASDAVQWVEVVKPQKRFCRGVVARGTSTTLDGIFAIQAGAHDAPAGNSTAGTIVGTLKVPVYP